MGSHVVISVLNAWSHGGRASWPDTPGMVIKAYLLFTIFQKRQRELWKKFRNNFTRICISIFSAYLSKGWYWRSWLGERRSQQKRTRTKGGKNETKWIDVCYKWALFKIELVTDLDFRYAKLVRLKNSFKHILVKQLTFFSSVPVYNGTSPSIKMAITIDSHLWESVSSIFLYFINFY